MPRYKKYSFLQKELLEKYNSIVCIENMIDCYGAWSIISDIIIHYCTVQWWDFIVIYTSRSNSEKIRNFWDINNYSIPYDYSSIMHYGQNVSPLHHISHFVCVMHQGPLLLAWLNFNPIVDKWLQPRYSVGLTYLSIPKLQRLQRWRLGLDE